MSQIKIKKAQNKITKTGIKIKNYYYYNLN